MNCVLFALAINEVMVENKPSAIASTKLFFRLNKMFNCLNNKVKHKKQIKFNSCYRLTNLKKCLTID